MPVTISETTIQNVLTRTTGYLRGVTSHSLQPYRGCTFGNALCGVGCYVRHNGHVVRGRTWGDSLEVRTNAADAYLAHAERERRWAHNNLGEFGIFCSSATDPFVPQEHRYRITESVLTAMLEQAPDLLILQTHSHRVTACRDLLVRLARLCRLRVHVSIESDRDRLPGLPPPASSVKQRLDACRALREAELQTVVCVAPLLPIVDPGGFFRAIADVADAVIVDHYIEGDGSQAGARTLRTGLPAAIDRVDPEANTLAYRDRIIDIARRIMPGWVGVGRDGFAGRFN